MTFSAVYLSALLLPGFLIFQIVQLKNQIFLFSLSLSLSFFVIVLLICHSFKFSLFEFYILYGTGLTSLLCLSLYRSIKLPKITFIYLLGYCLVIISSSLYLLIVGIYDELPSDVFRHLEYFKAIDNQIETGGFKDFNGLQVFSKSVLYWYHLPTIISKAFNLSFINHIQAFAAINVVVLLLCIYEFALKIFEGLNLKPLECFLIAILSVFFFVTYFGINVFSFIRYYSVAPTILNFSVYLTAMVCLLQLYQGELKFTKFAFLSITFLICTYLIHSQEALFIISLYIILTIVVLIRNLFSTTSTENSILTGLKIPKSYLPGIFLLLILVVIFYIYAINNIPLPSVRTRKLLLVSDFLGLDYNFYILNPFLQFYTVISHWGMLIILLYIFYFKKYFKYQLFLLVGILIPTLTIFNPLFTNIFLRIAYADVLWRFLYMMPLYFIAARLVIALLFEKEIHLINRLKNIGIICLIFIFLLPINTHSIQLPYSRIYTLGEVHNQARPSYWQDMIDFTNTLPNKETIITDPVTGYMISALTKHTNRRYKFLSSKMLDPYKFDSYENHPLKIYNGKVLIINLRTGTTTNAAKIGRHWNPNNLKVTDFYPELLLWHIEENSKNFVSLWETNDIKIYRIRY